MLTKEQKEGCALIVDLAKHMTTVSTGSVVILGTFLDKLFPHPVAKLCIYIALVGFVITIILCLFAFALAVDVAGGRQRYDKIIDLIEGIMVFAFFAFAISLVALVWFFMANF